MEAGTKVVDGLHGDASITAQEVGLEKLWIEPAELEVPVDDEEGAVELVPVSSGMDKLIKAMREM
eukprot:3033282-Karenia_brevis.AAC.1